MKAELKKIFKLFEKLEEACKTASLTLLTKGGKSMIKLQLESSPSTFYRPLQLLHTPLASYKYFAHRFLILGRVE